MIQIVFSKEKLQSVHFGSFLDSYGTIRKECVTIKNDLI